MTRRARIPKPPPVDLPAWLRDGLDAARRRPRDRLRDGIPSLQGDPAQRTRVDAEGKRRWTL